MPFTRPRSAADIMTRSLLPTLEGNYGMSKHLRMLFPVKMMINSNLCSQTQTWPASSKAMRQCRGQASPVSIWLAWSRAPAKWWHPAWTDSSRMTATSSSAAITMISIKYSRQFKRPPPCNPSHQSRWRRKTVRNYRTVRLAVKVRAQLRLRLKARDATRWVTKLWFRRNRSCNSNKWVKCTNRIRSQRNPVYPVRHQREILARGLRSKFRRERSVAVVAIGRGCWFFCPMDLILKLSNS